MLFIKSAHIVPWANKAEWFSVRENLTSDNLEDAMNAYETLASWKMKGVLPAFVECTYGLLKVMAQDYLLKKRGIRDYDIRLAYSTEIIRFVNHVHNVTKLRNSTLYNSARMNHIPEWIVTMRHEAAHGHSLPTVETFHLAGKVCMTWLLKNYWFFREKFTSKLEAAYRLYAEEFLQKHVNVKMYSIYKKTIKLWETCCEISNDCLISDLPSEHLYYVSNLVRFYKTHEFSTRNVDYCDFIIKRMNNYCVNGNEHRLKDLKRTVIELMKCITFDDRPKTTFMYTILQADFMFDFMHVEWKEVMYFVQVVKCFDLFIKALFDQVKDDNMVAMNVLEALAPSIENLRRQWPVYKKKFKDKSLSKKYKMKLKKKYCKSYKHFKFLLKLQKPPALTMNIMDCLFENPNKYSRNLICKYLPLIRPALSKNTIADFTELLDIYCGLDMGLDIQFPADYDNTKIYTLDDIKVHFDYTYNSMPTETDFSDTEENFWPRNSKCEEKWGSTAMGVLPIFLVPKLATPDEVRCLEVYSEEAFLEPPLVMPEVELFELLDYKAYKHT